MLLNIKNVGTIKKANINFDGLTVIAGENNTGKSTVGKLLFTIIKSISRYKEDLEENKENFTRKIIQNIYFVLRRNVDFTNNIEIREIFSPLKFFKDVEVSGIKAIDSRISYVKGLNENLFEETNLLSQKHIQSILNQLDNLKNELKLKNDKKQLIKNAFKKAIISEFRNEISSKNNDHKSTIQAYDFNNLILDIDIKSNSVKKFDLLDSLYFKDATFVESPIVLQLHDSIEKSKTYFELKSNLERINKLDLANIPLHIKDLHNKIKDSEFGDLFLSDLLFGTLYEDLRNIIQGEITYSSEERDFIYTDKNGNIHQSINTASGIKSFGIIQMLLKSDFINENSLLILDEPEVHLHPKWQLKFAQFIAKIVSCNINVLVTSHSPYMIEALQRYSEKEKLSVDFYFTENGVIEKVEDSNEKTLELIFEKLSEPFDEFQQMESERVFNG